MKTTKKKIIKKKTSKKVKKIDGLGPYEITKIRNAIRRIWQQSSLARKIVVDRCTDAEGYPKCEKCKKRCPKIFVNHLITVGDMDEGYIQRLWCSSTKLEGLCKKCHDPITAEERKLSAARKKQNLDFF